MTAAFMIAALAIWLAVACLAAVAAGRAIRLANQQRPRLTPADVDRRIAAMEQELSR